jgi:DNA-binding response OmpR family regulator
MLRYPRTAVERLVVLTDRSLTDALPAASALAHDVKVEPLDAESLSHAAELGAFAIVVDAEPDPAHAVEVLRRFAATRPRIPVVLVVARADLERFAWTEAGDDFVHPGVTPAELRLRLEMVRRRTGGGGDSMVRLGPLAVNGETYQVTVAGRVLDLTFKEFELLRFLVSNPRRVFTRSELLSKVWGYDFYGGTRTVDVHVRRLRAKLGSEHEALIQTVRGVGYRAAEPAGQD